MVIAVRRHAGRVVGPCGLLLLLAAPAASAATERFASPSGTGTACTLAAPCEIVTAVNNAMNGDDITIEPGTYGSPTPLATTLDDGGNTLTIHGQAGQPRPMIISTAGYGIELRGETAASATSTWRTRPANTGSTPKRSMETRHRRRHLTRIRRQSGRLLPIGKLTDSVCWSSGSSGIAATLLVVSSATATLRNDTLIASGSGGTAVAAHAFASTMTINLTNSIARGAGADISVRHRIEREGHGDRQRRPLKLRQRPDQQRIPGSTTSVTPAGSATNQTGAPRSSTKRRVTSMSSRAPPPRSARASTPHSTAPPTSTATHANSTAPPTSAPMSSFRHQHRPQPAPPLSHCQSHYRSWRR